MRVTISCRWNQVFTLVVEAVEIAAREDLEALGSVFPAVRGWPSLYFRGPPQTVESWSFLYFVGE
jgi:hypothetical protein